MAVKDLFRRHSFRETSYYLWRSKFGGMSVSDAKRLKELEAENTRLKRLLAERMFENDVIKASCERSNNRTGATRTGAATDGRGTERMSSTGRGAQERKRLALRATAGRQRRAARRIQALAQPHERYGVGMIHLKLRQAGLLVNHKRVERLCQEAWLQVRRRKRKRVAFGE